MRIEIEKVCETTRQSLVGLASLVVSTICGSAWLTVLIPLLLGKGDVALNGDSDTKMLMIVVGSGIALLLAVLSFGLERPVLAGDGCFARARAYREYGVSRDAVLDSHAPGGLVWVGRIGVHRRFCRG
jgi:hypothetical protein